MLQVTHSLRCSLFILLSSLASPDVIAEESIEDPRIEGAAVTRRGNELELRVSTSGNEVRIPRFFASIRTVKWRQGGDAPEKLTVTPEPDYWRVHWKNSSASGKSITIVFDSKPLLATETPAIRASGDGRFRLQACQAVTAGEKVRFEPQPHKNTVGYWVGKQDKASWTLAVDAPGEFNVGILQGCGKGQGGSDAVVELREQNSESSSELPFQVLETGHFQNFRWRHIGQIHISDPGTYTLTVRPTKIAKNALMDVREIQLVRLPK